MKNIFVMGSLNMDLCITCPSIPVAGETLIGSGFLSNSGGKGANQAVAVSKQGCKVNMLGAVGHDIFGAKLLKCLKNYNVNVNYVSKKDCSTGVAVIIVENNDNRIILDSGANYQYCVSDFEKTLRKNAKENDIFIAQLETPLNTVKEGLKLAKELKMITILNPAPAQTLDDEIFSLIDFLIPNETEAEQLACIKYNGSNVVEIGKSLLKKKVKNVIITLGDKGCVYFNDNETKHISAKKVQVLDTTAAGDTFIGVFASCIAKGQNVVEALEFATKAASLTVTKKGAQQSIPTYKEIIEFEN